jgi:hypothetical protein
VSEHAAHHPQDLRERTQLGDRGWTIFVVAAAVGAIGLIIAVILGVLAGDGFRRFFFVYLTNFAFFLSIGLGGLFFVLIQHVTRAGWSVTVRRLAENVAATLPVLGAMSAPIIIAVILNTGLLYPWAVPAHDDHHDTPAITRGSAAPIVAEAGTPAPADATGPRDPHDAHAIPDYKRKWLNPPLFTARVVLYFMVWSAIALWYWRTSVRQDQTGDPALTTRMEKRSPVALILLGVTLTLASFDLLMSLDPHWYSTIYGVYYFAGCACGIFSTLIIVSALLQRWGLLRQSITAEHYHDLGKLLFGFVFFWGYIAFSQYMLIWYAAIPEETVWFGRRGASTVQETFQLTWPWGYISVLLLVGHLLIPFAGLLSRQVKRRSRSLVFWAVWVLVFHWIDVSWLVMPEYYYLPDMLGQQRFPYGPMDLFMFLGLGGIFVAALARVASQASLRPTLDPRLHEAAAFQNI